MSLFKSDIFKILILTIILAVFLLDVKNRITQMMDDYGYSFENPKYNLEQMDFKHVDKSISNYMGYQYEL